MAFSFAWVDGGDAFVDRVDEDVFAFELSHLEGEFATLNVEIRNPRVGLLKPGRKRWCWLGKDGVALFHGRLVGIPINIREEVVTLNFVARPSDFDARKKAVAAGMRVFPYYDPLWIAGEMREDPDVVLEARPMLWHTDRVTHVVTATDLNAGEDGTVDLGGEIFFDGISIAYKGPPARKVLIEATCQWTQVASGTIDISKDIARLFGDKKVKSLTSQGLMEDWPKEGDAIGAGWSFGPCRCEANVPAFGIQYYTTKTITGQYIKWPAITLVQSTSVKYEVERTLIETITFEVTTDTQEILSDASDEETITIALQTEDVDQPIDPGGLAPIRDVRRRSFFPTDRGRQSISYLVALARAQLLSRARAVEITVETSLDHGLGLSCRKNVSIADPRLPGGAAIGKVAGYTLYLNGDTGQSGTRIVMSCTIGKGGSVAPAVGDPVWAEGYVALGYQKTDGGQIGFVTSDVVYAPPSVVTDGYDGTDFFNMAPETVIETLSLYNDFDDQWQVVNLDWGSVTAAAAALARTPTQIDLTLKPLKGGPFQTDYRLTVQPLAVLKTIDLEAP
jgi:hypothetical protein